MLFPIPLRASVVANPVILGVLHSISLILASKSVFLTSTLVFMALTLLTNSSYTDFLQLSFLLHYLSF